MIDLTKAPLFQLPVADQRRLDSQTRDMAIREGYAARMVGTSLGQCPLYRLDDMRVNWVIGWNKANNEVRELARQTALDRAVFLVPCRLEIDADGNVVSAHPDLNWLVKASVKFEESKDLDPEVKVILTSPTPKISL